MKGEKLQRNKYDSKENATLEKMRTESISTRKKIEAPPHFVSVFHETKSDFISGIDKDGLIANPEERNMSVGRMEVGNAMFNECIPDVFKFDITRNVIFAYPFLEHGHDQKGADKIFTKKKKSTLKGNYATIKKYSNKDNFLEKELGVASEEEYIAKMTDPVFLRSQHAGEVLEVKVNPEKCYVGDVQYINKIVQIGAQFSDADKKHVQEYAEAYWKNMITLKEFLEWYKKPEWDESVNDIKDCEQYRDEWVDTSNEYSVLKGAPEHFPDHIEVPEILIPTSIPQAHIRVLGNEDIPQAE